MIRDLIKKYTEGFKIKLSDFQISQLEAYFELLTEWNSKMNLTAITDEDGAALKHFADSLSVFNCVDIFEGASVIDIGTGAGFPGVVMKIARPDIMLTLLDSQNKRLIFLETLCSNLGVGAEIVHSRAEEGALNIKYRESFDFVVSRAVARLNILCEYCVPYVKIGGNFIAFKGSRVGDEIKEAENAVDILGGKLDARYKFTLADGGERNITVIKKIKDTPKAYPRKSAKIKNRPL